MLIRVKKIFKKPSVCKHSIVLAVWGSSQESVTGHCCRKAPTSSAWVSTLIRQSSWVTQANVALPLWKLSQHFSATWHESSLTAEGDVSPSFNISKVLSRSVRVGAKAASVPSFLPPPRRSTHSSHHQPLHPFSSGGQPHWTRVTASLIWPHRDKSVERRAASHLGHARFSHHVIKALVSC